MSENRTTIRGIDPEILEEARAIVKARQDYTMGYFISAALDYYIDSFHWDIEED